MTHMILGLFTDSKNAGEAISELKQKGYTKDISVLAQDYDQSNPNLTEIKQDVSDGTAVGATAGGALGGLAALLVGITSVAIPGLGILYGPLVALFSVAGGAATGALAGGLVGALVDLGISDATAKLYEERIRSGEVLVAVSTTENTGQEVRTILEQHGVEELSEVEHV